MPVCAVGRRARGDGTSSQGERVGARGVPEGYGAAVEVLISCMLGFGFSGVDI